jgi:hypothetical protein
MPACLGQGEKTPQDSGARRARRATRVKRGGNLICPRRAFLACLALHAARSVAAGGIYHHPARVSDPVKTILFGPKALLRL